MCCGGSLFILESGWFICEDGVIEDECFGFVWNSLFGKVFEVFRV